MIKSPDFGQNRPYFDEKGPFSTPFFVTVAIRIDAPKISEQLIDDRSAVTNALMISEQLIDNRSWRNGQLVVPTRAAKRQHSQG